jgi:hypothetical protein
MLDPDHDKQYKISKYHYKKWCDYFGQRNYLSRKNYRKGHTVHYDTAMVYSKYCVNIMNITNVITIIYSMAERLDHYFINEILINVVYSISTFLKVHITQDLAKLYFKNFSFMPWDFYNT